jgi:hypothetical protein
MRRYQQPVIRAVMAGSGHPADFVGGDPVVPALHVLVWKAKLHQKTWNARDKRGHDGRR